jgi:ATP-dependent Lon protease
MTKDTVDNTNKEESIKKDSSLSAKKRKRSMSETTEYDTDSKEKPPKRKAAIKALENIHVINHGLPAVAETVALPTQAQAQAQAAQAQAQAQPVKEPTTQEIVNVLLSISNIDVDMSAFITEEEADAIKAQETAIKEPAIKEPAIKEQVKPQVASSPTGTAISNSELEWIDGPTTPETNDIVHEIFNETTDEEEEEEEEADEYEEYDEEELPDHKKPDIIINIGELLGKPRNMPTCNIENETTEVKKFVELITKPNEHNDIDNQIKDFKELDANRQKSIIDSLQLRQKNENSLSTMCKIIDLNVPPTIKTLLLNKYNAIREMDSGSNEYFKQKAWLDKVCSIPFGTYKNIPVTIEDGIEKCGEFIEKARKYLDDAIYGQEEAKLQILQFIANKITNYEAHGLSLLLAGPPGVGKTSLIKNGIAKALDWPFQFISLGGDSDASTYTGHQLVYEGSHCGKIVNSLIAAKSMSMVLMFDEVDKISTTPKGEEVSHMLIHLTDPVQNGDFEDKYLSGIPIDLGRTLIVFSGNDVSKIDRILLDRLIVIQLDGYTVENKIKIANHHLIPEALSQVKLTGSITFTDDIIKYIIKNYAQSESGVRELKRCLDGIIQKVNMLRIYNNPVLPYYIKDFTIPYTVQKDHVDLFLKKKQPKDNGPPLGMYI